ncbi:hypothetical protein [uncultured Fructobacillus sp.]|uniref:hypothetical protein n=1 Tax=uncultured Fructobacillus sp. TaxID=591942 RepID=UPI00259865E2|nr:hypothetical protein [uncultured Fructobacillus sp.]
MKVYKSINFITNLVLVFLVVTSLIGAIAILEDSLLKSNSSLFVFFDILLIFFVITFLFKFIFSRQFKVVISWLNQFFYNKFFLFSLAILIIIWQLQTVGLLTGSSGWDFTIISTQVLVDGGKHGLLGWSDYFSFYPNNLMLLRLETIYWHITGQVDLNTFIYYLNLLNVVIVDVATILLVKMANSILNKFGKNLVILLTVFLFTVVPFFVIPYSDTISFLVTTIFIYVLNLFRHQQTLKRLMINAPILALVLCFGYFIKPSLIVLLVSTFIMALLYLFINNHLWLTKKNLFFVTVTFGVFFLIPAVIITSSLNNYDYSFKVNRNLAFPATHFIAMGLTNKGGFNTEDSKMTAHIKNPNERNQVAIAKIKQRLGDYGVLGYEKFLIQKQMNNSSDGTLGWGQEGNFLTVYNKNNIGMNKSFQRKYFLNKNGLADNQKFEFKTIQQLIWILTLILILFSTLEYSQYSLFLKISAIGFFTFLLIFEGGRSRYLLQFLPVLLLIAGFGFQQFVLIFKKIHMNMSKL